MIRILTALACVLAAAPALAQDTPENLDAVEFADGRWYAENGVPTFKVEDDGTVDWATYSGFRRYHSECHVCHGPAGEGSSYAPALKVSALDMDYYDFVDVVTNGRQKVNAAENSVMPAFGTNANVMCYLDDIYIYLKAHGSGAVGRERPAKRAEKPEITRELEAACLGQ